MTIESVGQIAEREPRFRVDPGELSSGPVVPEGTFGDRAAQAPNVCFAVAAGLGHAFRPKDVLFVSDLPKTRNMKIMRRVVRAAVLGQNPGDADPDAIKEIEIFRTVVGGRTVYSKA